MKLNRGQLRALLGGGMRSTECYRIVITDVLLDYYLALADRISFYYLPGPSATSSNLQCRVTHVH